MMRGHRGVEPARRAAVRDSAGNITTPGRDPYGGTGEWSFRRNARRDQGVLAGRHPRGCTAEDIEGVVTLGMRGNGDVSLPDGDGIDLMSEIIDTQREILAEDTRRPADRRSRRCRPSTRRSSATGTSGYRPPDDVTVVFCDDNWGNLRKLPDPRWPRAAAVTAMYYHFDYVGGGRNYKWVDTINLANMWEQLHLATPPASTGLWVVNVGDLKNDELPAAVLPGLRLEPRRAGRWTGSAEWERALRRAELRRPAAPRRSPTSSHEYGAAAVPAQAGAAQPADHPGPGQGPGDRRQRGGLRRPGPRPFSLDRLPRDGPGHRGVAGAGGQGRDASGRALPASSAQDAYYQLVVLPGQGHREPLRAAARPSSPTSSTPSQGRAATNDLAAAAEARFADDQALSRVLQHRAGRREVEGLADPAAHRLRRRGPLRPERALAAAGAEQRGPAGRDLPAPCSGSSCRRRPSSGVAVDGSEQAWPGGTGDAVLPAFSPYQTPAGAVRRGVQPGHHAVRLHDHARAGRGCSVDRPRGTVTQQVRATVTVDWRSRAEGHHQRPDHRDRRRTARRSSSRAPIDNPALKRPPRASSRPTATSRSRPTTTTGRSAARASAGSCCPDIGQDRQRDDPVAGRRGPADPGRERPHLEYTADVHQQRPGEPSGPRCPRATTCSRPTA